MTDPDPDTRPAQLSARRSRAGTERPSHPTVAAALLMLGIVILIVALSLAGVYTS